ncbi:hypothetical protein [Chryseobacterium hagamense]|nr:hypothetical protein [Chryseobacterium hagamense]
MRKNYLINLFGGNPISLKHKNLLVVLIMFMNAFVDGQSTQSYQLPNIIKPSPVAQNFMRYGEIPVDYSTGVPKIEIPIYTVEGKQLKFPISISYHASGIKVSDVPSEIGIGWILNAGGIVTRMMLDTMDEAGASIKTYSSASQFLTAIPNIIYGSLDTSCSCYPGSHSLEMYLDTKCNNEDLMSDRYFYSLPSGVSGIFRYNYPTRDTLITLPYRPFKIERTITDQFKIKDDHGILYTFQRFQDSSYGSSEWFLNEMVSADGTESIKFNYITQQPTPTGSSVNTIFTPKEFMNGNNCNPAESESYPSEYGGGTGGGTYSVVLSSIETNDDIITFSYTDREDFQFLKKVSEIRVASKNLPSIIRKKITFDHSYFGTKGYGWGMDMDKRLKLNSLNVYDANNSVTQNYSFTYEQSVMLPPYLSRAFDFWGYYNGTNNGSATPENMLPINYQGHGYGGDRHADNGSFSKACILTEIKYPTGGKTKFNFERAYVEGLFDGPVNSGGYIGALRISKITNYLKDNEIANIKSYVYSGPKFNKITTEFYSYLQKYIDYYDVPSPIANGANDYCWVFYKRNIISSSPIAPHDLAPGLAIAYSDVTEYNGTLSDNLGSTKYYYSTPDLLLYTGFIRDLHTFQNDKGNYEPKLIGKIIKSKTGSLISEEYNSYTDHFEHEFKTGINIIRTLDYIPRHRNSDLPVYATSPTGQIAPFSTNDYIQSIRAFDTKAYQKVSLLDYSIKKEYDHLNPNKFIKDSTAYSYNQHNLMIQQTTTVNSKGENIQTQYKYPYDFSSVQPYQTMLSKNILTPVIEQTISNTTLNKQLQKTQTSYKDWGNNIIEPEIVKGQMDAASPLENRIRYLSYDSKTNPLTVKKEVGNPLTYLWGYNKTLPIAAVENAKYVSETINNDLNVSYSGLQIPPGNINQELGTFTITEEKDYKIDRIYERYPENYSVMYQTSFQNMNNSSGTVFFTDTTPASGNFYTYTSPSVHLKPGTYKVKLTNIGYNGYQGQIENNFNFTVYNAVEASVPFHTSFEEESVDISTAYAITGKVSHTGAYIVNLPPAALGYDKVIVSYWGKSGASSPWQYVENTVTLGSSQNYSIGSNYTYIDEVRVYPVDARMKTYTYDPFYKTQTSIMNENGQTEYYDYDAFGRLKEVYIMEGNVKKTIKTTNYHYKP